MTPELEFEDGYENELEDAASVEELRTLCTVPVWLPGPWPEEFETPRLRAVHFYEETGYTAVGRARAGGLRLVISGASVRYNALGANEQLVAESPFRVYSLGRPGSTQLRVDTSVTIVTISSRLDADRMLQIAGSLTDQVR